MREELEGVFEAIDDVEVQQKKRIVRRILLVVLGLSALIYLYSLLFGNYSWSILSTLRKEKIQILQQIKKLETENVVLQKMIFELKGLEPSSEE